MAIAERIFEQHSGNCKVYGVEMVDSTARYISVDNFEACNRLQGSKYIDSELSGTFGKILSDLSQGIAVLFVGTPCRVAALKAYLLNQNANTDRLVTVDLICHGIGDKRIWSGYVAWLEKRYHSKIKRYCFRDKSTSWSGYPVRVEFENGKILKDTYDSRTFIRAYFKLYAMRSGCFDCKFKNLRREGDLTIGDYWGVQNDFPQIEASAGVSLILVNTQKGEYLIGDITKHIKKTSQGVIEECHGDGYMQHQDNLQAGLKKPANYDVFWEFYQKNGFESVLKAFKLYTLHGAIRAIGGRVIRRVRRCCGKNKK